MRSVDLLRPGGRLVPVASEPDAEAAAKRGAEALYFVVEPNAARFREISRMADEGKLRSLVAEVYSLDRAREAFERSLYARQPVRSCFRSQNSRSSRSIDLHHRAVKRTVQAFSSRTPALYHSAVRL